MTEGSFKIRRKKTRVISVGGIEIGGENPICVQSMTTCRTADISAMVKQIHQLEAVNCDIVRLAVNKQEAADALEDILRQIHIPLVADIHFDYRMALQAMKYDVACVRINPGNIGAEWKVGEIVKKAKDRGIALRIGVNAGSLEKKLLKEYGHPTPQALVQSSLSHIEFLEKLGFYNFKVSIKSSDVLANYQACILLSNQTEAPLHLGITEAGTKSYGMVKSAVGIGSLLLRGIGDTIRVSLSSDPVDEVKAGVGILKSLGLRDNVAEVISCPTCARTEIDVFHLAEEVERRALALGKNVKIAVMGCAVNGPGEAREADIGIAGGKGEGLVYRKGVPVKKLPQSEMLNYLMDEVQRM